MFKKLRQTLARLIWVDDEPKGNVVDLNQYRQRRARGFIAYGTNKRVDIDPVTKCEVVVGEI